MADASGAHVEVLARNRDDGAPDGEPYVSLNERYGPSVVSSAEAVKRRRRYDGDDPNGAGSGGKGAAGGFCVAPIGSA